MPQEVIIEFAKLLVQNVRDRAISSCNAQLHTDNLNSPIAKRWREARNSGKIDEFGEMIIADSVDDAIFYLLDAIDNGVINISFNSSSGKAINLSDEGLGELAGDFAGEWCAKYSSEPYYDYLSGNKNEK